MQLIKDGKTGKTARLLRNKTDVALVNNTAKSQIFTVPTGKRWLILSAKIHNGDDVARTCTIAIRDSADVIITYMILGSSIPAGAWRQAPRRGTVDVDCEAPCEAYPFMLDAGEDVQFYWAAGGASTGGTATVFLSVLEIDAEEVI